MECIEIAARTLCLSVILTYSRECEWTICSGPLERNISNCTHFIVSILKAWNVTVVGIECNDAAFTSFQEAPHQNLFFQEKSSKFGMQGYKLDYTRYSQLSLLQKWFPLQGERAHSLTSYFSERNS